MSEAPDMRQLIAAVVASFGPIALDDGGWQDAEIALLTDLRERFICAGAAHLENVHNPQRWLQVGVRFKSQRQCRSFLRGRLGPAAKRWLAERRIRHFFFMVKPPGLRLRFCGAGLDRDLAPRLHRLLDRERTDGTLVSYEPGVYDAETYQFGGDVGLDIAHDLFNYDSLAILDLLRSEAPRETLPVLSLTVLNHLLAELCADPWELWDGWCNMRLVQRIPTLDPGALAAAAARFEEQRELLARTVWDRDSVLAELPPPQRRVLTRYLAENVRLARRLRQAARSGELLYGPRKIFPFYAIFQWNRWMFSLRTQAALAFYMQRLLDPKGA
jgi:thiopeptide-type bacteriocin biosynthesis protein